MLSLPQTTLPSSWHLTVGALVDGSSRGSATSGSAVVMVAAAATKAWLLLLLLLVLLASSVELRAGWRQCPLAQK